MSGLRAASPRRCRPSRLPTTIQSRLMSKEPISPILVASNPFRARPRAQAQHRKFRSGILGKGGQSNEQGERKHRTRDCGHQNDVSKPEQQPRDKSCAGVKQESVQCHRNHSAGIRKRAGPAGPCRKTLVFLVFFCFFFDRFAARFDVFASTLHRIAAGNRGKCRKCGCHVQRREQ